MSLLEQQLSAAAAASYPLHMPGHKRRMQPAPGLECAAWDTTETAATDDLHEAEGILADAMGRTAALCGAARSWYLVNGSTVGLLAGIRALAPRGSEILAARNCHKAVYHAIELGGLTAHWLVPPVDAAFGVYGSIAPAAVKAALTAHPGVRCVVLTSPTYEGVLSDIASISAICHRHGVPLLVDEAHGAHLLPLARPYGWQGGAVAGGADLVVQSAHKTLPSLTQTALLHWNGGPLADPEEVERQLDVFETSSPSYPLMASLDGCTGLLAAQGDALFAAWRARLNRFFAAAERWRHIRLLCHGRDSVQNHPLFFGFDDSKLLLDIGQEGAAFLRANGFEPEMVCGQNLLAMTSPCDEDAAFERLAALLTDYDAALPGRSPALPGTLPLPGRAVCTIEAALLRPFADIPLAQAAGRTAAEYVWAYPPGVPLLAPGEEVTPDFVAAAGTLAASGTRLRHTGCKNSAMVRVAT